MWQDTPKDVPVLTSIGEVYVNPTSRIHAYIDCNSNGRCIVVSGKPLRFTMHMEKVQGKWKCQSFYCKKVDAPWNKDEATTIQKKKVLDAVLPVLYAWFADNPAIMEQAHAAFVNNHTETLLEKKAELLKEVAEIDAQIEGLKAVC